MHLLDTHLHLIHRDRFRYDWTAEVPPLASGDFTLADYRALTGDEVGEAVFMEVDVPADEFQDEARFVASLVHNPGNRLAGMITACRPETDAGFEAWIDEAAGLGAVGFRRVLHVVPDDVSQSETFRRNVATIGARGLVFDMCFLARQLPLAADLARACPETRLVLDHCGVPDIAGGAFDDWRAGLHAVAACDNVVCKLSGITAYCGEGQATFETVRPWVEEVLAAFGPERVCWGSDWPVVNLGAGLAGWLEITRRILSDLSDSEAAAIAEGTARRIYGL